jgi:inosose dehydratase
MTEADLRDLIVSARNCGATAPIITFTMGGARAEWPERRSELVDRLAVLGDLAAAEGAILAVEPHARGLIDSVDRAEWLMHTVDQPAVRLNFDASHYALPGVAFDLADAVGRLLPWSVHAHIKDSIGEGDGFRFVLPGDGPFDLAAYFAALERAGWTRPVTVEVSAMVFNRPGYDPFDAVNRTYETLDAARRATAPAI